MLFGITTEQETQRGRGNQLEHVRSLGYRITTISTRPAELYASKGETRYRVRYRKPDGTQTDKRGFKRKVDAENWAAKRVTVAKAEGTYIDPQAGKATVGELAPAWLAKKKLSTKPSHYRNLEGAWEKWVKPEWGNTPVSAVTRETVQQWVTGISQGKTVKDERGNEIVLAKPRSASVVLRAHGVLAGILDDAKKDRRIPDNPARGIELPRKRRKKHVYLTAEQLDRLAGSVTPWRRDLVLVLGLCGMRWGELIPLRVMDVDLEKHRIYIGVSAPMVGGVIIPDDTKTYKARAIMYPVVLDPIMRRLCADRKPGDLLFEQPGREGMMIREWGNASRDDGWLSVGLRRAGIPGHLTIHDLRHTAASLMVRAGANVKAVQRQLGHKSAAMTLDVYADLFDDDLDELSERMGEMLARENVGKMWAKIEPRLAAVTTKKPAPPAAVKLVELSAMPGGAELCVVMRRGRGVV